MSFSHSLKIKSGSVWEEGYNHPFVQELGQGVLNKKVFEFYLLQDFHYLLDYAKVFAIATVKSKTELQMSRFTSVQHSIFNHELNMHREYCRGFGLGEKEICEAKQSLYNRTYTANILAVAQTGDLAEIMAALFPCAWTYHDYAVRLKAQYADRLENNFFKSWIDIYSSEMFADSFGWFYDEIDELCRNKTQAELKSVEDIFVRSVEFEYLFFDMAYKQEMGYKL
jgi:thiaminase/transcriptional activator TenA